MNRPRMGLDDLGKLAPLLGPVAGADAMIRAYLAYLELADDWYQGQVSTSPDKWNRRKTVGGRTAYGTRDGGAPPRVSKFAQERKRAR